MQTKLLLLFLAYFLLSEATPLPSKEFNCVHLLTAENSLFCLKANGIYFRNSNDTAIYNYQFPSNFSVSQGAFYAIVYSNQSSLQNVHVCHITNKFNKFGRCVEVPNVYYYSNVTSPIDEEMIVFSQQPYAIVHTVYDAVNEKRYEFAVADYLWTTSSQYYMTFGDCVFLLKSQPSGGSVGSWCRSNNQSRAIVTSAPTFTSRAKRLYPFVYFLYESGSDSVLISFNEISMQFQGYNLVNKGFGIEATPTGCFITSPRSTDSLQLVFQNGTITTLPYSFDLSFYYPGDTFLYLYNSSPSTSDFGYAVYTSTIGFDFRILLQSNIAPPYTLSPKRLLNGDFVFRIMVGPTPRMDVIVSGKSGDLFSTTPYNFAPVEISENSIVYSLGEANNQLLLLVYANDSLNTITFGWLPHPSNGVMNGSQAMNQDTIIVTFTNVSLWYLHLKSRTNWLLSGTLLKLAYQLPNLKYSFFKTNQVQYLQYIFVNNDGGMFVSSIDSIVPNSNTTILPISSTLAMVVNENIFYLVDTLKSTATAMYAFNSTFSRAHLVYNRDGNPFAVSAFVGNRFVIIPTNNHSDVTEVIFPPNSEWIAPNQRTTKSFLPEGSITSIYELCETNSDCNDNNPLNKDSCDNYICHHSNQLCGFSSPFRCMDDCVSSLALCQ